MSINANRQTQVVRIGVLAVQGGFSEHITHLNRSKDLFLLNNAITTTRQIVVEISTVKTSAHLEGLDGLVIPGGESTTMSIFLEQNNFELLNNLKKFTQHKPTFGTCAGLIMLANKVQGQTSALNIIGGLDITVSRNYYGRQKQSFETVLNVDAASISQDETPVIFIRAPAILTFDPVNVIVLASHNQSPVAVQQGNLLATSFHPELTSNLSWHLYFINMVMTNKLEQI